MNPTIAPGNTVMSVLWGLTYNEAKMKKLFLVLSLALVLSLSNASAKSKALQEDVERNAYYIDSLSLKKEVKEGKLRQRGDRAVEALVIRAVGELRKQGAKTLANNIERDYETRYKNFLSSPMKGVGDHEGVAWLLAIHESIEFVLGESLCRMTRLHDIWVLAETIPVVFSCLDNVDSVEYLLHFVPFCGVTTYWIGNLVCMGATLGTGVAFVCGAGATALEMVVTRFVAPPLSQPCWKKVCGH